jgi:hypothetical protein
MEPSFHCTITCDVCLTRGNYRAPTAEQVDALIARDGWTRFAPTGSDLCKKCKGSSPNTIIQVRKP